MNRPGFAFAVSIVCAVVSFDAHPADSSAFALGIGLNTATLSPRHGGANESGIGLELTGAYLLSASWSVIASTSGARLDDAAGASYTLGHLDALGRYRFRATQHGLQPYVEAGVTRRTARFAQTNDHPTSSLRHSGASPTIGAGLDYALTPSISLGASLRYAAGELSRNDCPSGSERTGTCATSTRVALRVDWYPWRT